MVFGGTGDLALRKLLPALYLRDRDGQLPDGSRVIGVSRAEARRRGLPGHGRATRSTTTSQPQDLDDAVVDAAARPPAPRRARHRGRRRLAPAARPAQGRRGERGRHPRVLPRRRAGPLRHDLRAPRRGRPGDRARPASCWRSRSAPTSRARGDQRGGRPGLRRGAASSASTTTSARRPCRTCSSRASPTRCSSRCGTAAGSTTCRSPWPRRSASEGAATTTTAPARCATWCRTTCCSCCAWSPWSRRPTSTARRCATRSSRCSRRCAR